MSSQFRKRIPFVAGQVVIGCAPTAVRLRNFQSHLGGWPPAAGGELFGERALRRNQLEGVPPETRCPPPVAFAPASPGRPCCYAHHNQRTIFLMIFRRKAGCSYKLIRPAPAVFRSCRIHASWSSFPPHTTRLYEVTSGRRAKWHTDFSFFPHFSRTPPRKLPLLIVKEAITRVSKLPKNLRSSVWVKAATFQGLAHSWFLLGTEKNRSARTRRHPSLELASSDGRWNR